MDDDAITQWALAAQAGDRDAATAFIRATTPPLRRLLSYLTEPHQVEDLLQDTYLRAFTALPRYAARCPARLWLVSIARRVAADHVRLAQRRPRISDTDWQRAADQSHTAPGSAHLVELRQALTALKPERREAFVLTQVLDLSYAEAAVICGCPVGTIRSRVFRARTDLLTALTADDQLPHTAHGH